MEIASTEQHPILREHFLGVDAERGSISTKLAMVAGSAIVAAGFALGAGENAIHHPMIKNETDVSAGRGTLTAVKKIVPEACFGVYEADINGATAKYSKTFKLGPLSIPTSYSASSTFNGNLTNRVCHDSFSLEKIYDKTTKKYNVTLPGSAFHTDVYRTNPLVNAFTPDNGFLMAKRKDIENDLNSIGNISVHHTDGLMGTLNGLAELAADQTSTEACGHKAWIHLEPMYTDALQGELVADANYWAQQLGLKKSDFNVIYKGKITFTNQYANELKAAKVEADKLGVEMKLPDPAITNCADGRDLQKQLANASGAAK